MNSFKMEYLYANFFIFLYKNGKRPLEVACLSQFFL